MSCHSLQLAKCGHTNETVFSRLLSGIKIRHYGSSSIVLWDVESKHVQKNSMPVVVSPSMPERSKVQSLDNVEVKTALDINLLAYNPT
jgi:hypothetical protein